MKREIRAKLALLYYQLATLPGMDSRTVELAASMTMLLIESKKRIDIDDLVLPWKPLYHLLEKELVRDTASRKQSPSYGISLHSFPRNDLQARRR
jgi:hypothetical protein